MSIGNEISRSLPEPRGYELFPSYEFYPHLTKRRWAALRGKHYERICGGPAEIGTCDGCGERKVVYPCNGAPLANGSICIKCLETD